jgi:hypothetical protein
MSKNKLLAALLMFFGVVGIFALGAVLMPIAWMEATHRWLDLGEMPRAPIVGYLARSLSLFYAFLSVLCLIMARNVERYRPLLRQLGLLLVAMGGLQIFICIVAEMPWWWTIQEGPVTCTFGALIFHLARD